PGVESQEAVFETAVPNAITLRGTDAAGTPVEGATVTFTPDAGNGSVSVASAVSDADGEVSTVWTLGTPFGRQRLVASTDGGAE
ncbi:MAG: hypothetical protein GWN73_20660, partial [Actinobacteria bacterium]|nr:hypothetical protein [Actinomycetota bacterium]NIU67706.1 hypothetical protein [Actinomycetota bacterium]